MCLHRPIGVKYKLTYDKGAPGGKKNAIATGNF